MNKMTEDSYRIGDPKVMTNTKGAPVKIARIILVINLGILICLHHAESN